MEATLEVIDKGNPATILEYGILWTTSSALGTIGNLVYSDPLASGIHKDFTSGDTSTGITWTKNATGLPANTTTYYRAFARNSTGTDYGDVKTQQTEPPPPPPTFHVYVDATWTGPDDDDAGFGGVLKLFEGTTLIASRVFSPNTKFEAIDWEVPSSGTYVLRFNDVSAWLDGDENLKDERWRWMSSPTWIHTSQTTNITESDTNSHYVYYEIQESGEF